MRISYCQHPLTASRTRQLKVEKFTYDVNLRHNMTYICNILHYWGFTRMSFPAPTQSALLHMLLERVLRTECLTLESLRLQAKIHNGLLGGEVDELVQAAEQRAYQRAETLLTHLLAATADSPVADTDFPTAFL